MQLCLLLFAFLHCLVAQPNAFIPKDLLKFAGSSIQETNLRVAIFKNSTRGVENAADETFERIARRRRIRYYDMVKFINETQIEVRKRVNETDLPASGLTSQVIHRAAAIQMLEIAGAVNASVKEKQFERYVSSLLDTPIYFAPRICQELQVQTLRCQALSRNNHELHQVLSNVRPRMEATQALCDAGLTSLGQYRVESCQLSAVTESDDPRIRDYEVACMRQFQCYMMPEEPRLNPWNVSIPEQALMPISTSAPKSTNNEVDDQSVELATMVGRQAILTQLITEALHRRATIQTIIKTLVSGAIYSLAIAMLFVISPSGLLLSSTTYGLVPWGATLFGGHVVSNLAYPSGRVTNMKHLEEAIQNLNVISN